MANKNGYLKIQLCTVKINTMKSDIKKWNMGSLKDADRAEVLALLDRIRSLENEIKDISTVQFMKMNNGEIKTLENRCNALARDWKEIRLIITACQNNKLAQYFSVLKIKPTNDFDEIKKAYKKRAQEVHPDKSNGDDKEFIKLKEAYDILKAEFEK